MLPNKRLGAGIYNRIKRNHFKRIKQIDMKETTENNILLAEFLGVKQKENNWFDGYELQKAGLPFNYGAMGNGTSNLKFHTSWDWLMEVVEKIERLLPDDSIVNIAYKDCYIPVIEGEFTIETNGSTKIEAVYYACVDFINWYNENKSK